MRYKTIADSTAQPAVFVGRQRRLAAKQGTTANHLPYRIRSPRPGEEADPALMLRTGVLEVGWPEAASSGSWR